MNRSTLGGWGDVMATEYPPGKAKCETDLGNIDIVSDEISNECGESG